MAQAIDASEAEASAVGDDETSPLREPAQEPGVLWALPVQVDMACEALHIHEVRSSVADNLVGEGGVTVPRVAGPGYLHGRIFASGSWGRKPAPGMRTGVA